MYIISFINVDILVTLYFYTCRWNMKIWNKMKSIKKTFQITQEQYPMKSLKRRGMEEAQVTTIVQAMNDDQ